jgi:hypothetical protein
MINSSLYMCVYACVELFFESLHLDCTSEAPLELICGTTAFGLA